MFIVAFFVIAKNNPMPTNRWMNKKQVEVHPYNRLLLSDKKEWTIDKVNNMDESQNNYTEWKKSDNQGVHTVWLHLHETLENAN